MLASKALPFLYCAFGAGSLYSANYQFQQKKQNDQYISTIHKRISSEPIECPTKLTCNELNNEYKYRSVSITGTIDKSNTVIMANYVYSPLTTETGHILIVNRGWIPKQNLKQYTQQNINISSQYQKMDRFHGIISTKHLAPFFEPYLKKHSPPKINKTINSTVWQFKGQYYKKSKPINSMETGIENVDCIVVDLIESQNERDEMNKYEPHRLTKNDIYGMIDVEQEKRKHIQYAVSFIFAGIACFGYSYYLMRIPSGFHRINTMRILLNNPLKI